METHNAIIQTTQPRPCFVEGRRAIFHRWSDNARPVKPRGMEDDETVEHFQLHAVHAIVEYEDGTVGRVWPNMVQFADPEMLFQGYDWEAMERQRDGELPFTYNGMNLAAEGVTIDTVRQYCDNCAHQGDNQEICETVDFMCKNCPALSCYCRNCAGYSKWEPKGGTA